MGSCRTTCSYILNELQFMYANSSLSLMRGLKFSVTRNYFENLVRALENGLSDVDSHGACNRTASSKSLGAGSSKGRTNKGKSGTARSSSSRNLDDSGHWSCEYCTFANVKSANVCQMCQQRR